MADFTTRSAASGVLLAHHWDSPSKLGGYWSSYNYPNRYGMAPNAYGLPPFGPNDPRAIWPTIDLQQGCTTAGALRFDIPSVSPANAAGSWTCRFTSDDSTLIGPAADGGRSQTLYVQLRTKWNSALANNQYLDSQNRPQGGIKYFDISTGYPLSYSGSSSDTKQVISNINGLSGISGSRRIPYVYYYFGSWAENFNGVSQANFQNNRSSPYCGYPTWANCLELPADTWITFKIYYNVIGRTASNPNMCDFQGKLWMQIGGGASTLLVDYSPSTVGYLPCLYNDPALKQAIGQLNIFPYMTDKNESQSLPAGIAWYDELIISTEDIADADAPVTLVGQEPGITGTSVSYRIRKVFP